MLLLVALICQLAGCQFGQHRGAWYAPQLPLSQFIRDLAELERQATAGNCGAAMLAHAVAAEREGNPNCSGLYYQAALASAACLAQPDQDPTELQIAGQVQQHSLRRMLDLVAVNSPTTAWGNGIPIRLHGQVVRIPVALHGFAWNADDFQRLHVVESYWTESVSRVHRRPGIGVPVVFRRVRRTGNHAEEQFLPERSAFAATATLSAQLVPGQPGETPQVGSVLEFHNPHAIRAVAFGPRRLALAADLSAPLAYLALRENERVNPYTWFLDAASAQGQEGLYFLEPYQPGKIPLVLVHGLVSSPSTWIDLTNDLRASPGFDDRYQIWAFRYATGASFLRAAARLRRDLYTAVETIDASAQDPSLRAMVLAGHSMGGLVSKLQVTGSGDTLWRAVATRPFEHIAATEATRQELAEVLFFEAQPYVRRVIFMAVPHGGSTLAVRPVGQLSAALAQPDPERAEQYARLIEANPGVFAPEFESRLPTSVDMLQPDNPLLQAIRHLPLAASVRAHSIVGTGGKLSVLSPGDGVVPVDSAVHPQVESTHYVPTTHSHVQREEETCQIVRGILARHLDELALTSSGSPGLERSLSKPSEEFATN